MTVVTVSVEVDASPERVWEIISDPRNLPHWERHIVAVNGVPATGLHEGSRYVAEMRLLAVRTKVHAEVLEWDPPRRVSIRLTGVLDATVTSTVEPLGARKSRLKHVVEYRFRGGPLGLVGRSLRMVGGARYALRHGTLAQKREIEAGSSG
jgi:uncharacterized protein YndB with AHSA1/START domain